LNYSLSLDVSVQQALGFAQRFGSVKAKSKSEVTHYSYQCTAARVDKNRDFFNKNKKKRFFYLNPIFLI